MKGFLFKHLYGMKLNEDSGVIKVHGLENGFL